jgi:hypothetical protein
MASSALVRPVRSLEVVLGGLLLGACLFIAPLDDVGTVSNAPDSSAGTAGTDGSGGTAGSGGEASTECTENSRCIRSNADDPFRCLEGKCVQLTSSECIVRGPVEHAHALFFGAFASLNDARPGFDDITWNYELALKEINMAGGLPYPNGVRRPLVLVICDSGEPQDDPEIRLEHVLAGAAHLTEKVRVPGIVAALESGDLLAAFDQYGRDKGVFFLTPGPATATLVAHGDPANLLWHMLGLPQDLAPAYASLLPVLESRVREWRAIPAGNPLKVALVYSDEVVDTELKSAAVELLKFNGKTLEENGANYFERLVPRNASDAQITSVVTAIHAFRPHIVVSIAGSVFSRNPSGVLMGIELGWPPPDTDRPYYILSPNNFPQASSDVAGMIRSVLLENVPPEPDAQKRFIGINVAGSEDGVLYNRYLDRLSAHAEFATKGSENYYDAVYFLAYAAFAGAPRSESVFGSDIVNGMERLITGGIPFNVGPDDVVSVFSELGQQDPQRGRIRLNGTLGPPRFSRDTGARIDTASIFCFEKHLTPPPLEVHPQVGYFDRDVTPALLRVSRLFANKTLPCLTELGLPAP